MCPHCWNTVVESSLSLAACDSWTDMWDEIEEGEAPDYGVGETHDSEAGQAVRDVHFDQHGSTLDAEKGCRGNGGDHELTPWQVEPVFGAPTHEVRSIPHDSATYRWGVTLTRLVRAPLGGVQFPICVLPRRKPWSQL